MISYGKITQEDKDRIDSWIKSIQKTTSLIKLYSVLQGLQTERELIDNDVFHIPLRRFRELKAEDIEALFHSLMMKGIIASGTDDEDILKNPKLASKADSWVGIEPERFLYLLDLPPWGWNSLDTLEYWG